MVTRPIQPIPHRYAGGFCHVRRTVMMTQERAVNRALMPLDSSQLPELKCKAPLRRKIALALISLSAIAAASGTSKADVSHFISGRRSKVGRSARARIIAELRRLGFIKPRLHHAPTCRRCGLEYPTRKATQGAVVMRGRFSDKAARPKLLSPLVLVHGQRSGSSPQASKAIRSSHPFAGNMHRIPGTCS